MYDTRRDTSTRSPSVTAPAPTTAVAPGASNSAAQDALGLTGPVPAPASTTHEALGAMGAMGAVVLDALPLAIAVPLALGLHDQAWAKEWVLYLENDALIDAGLDLARRGVSAAWPVGLGVEVDAALQVGALVFQAGAAASARALSTPDGIQLDITAGAQDGFVFALGAGISGADNSNVLAAGAKANLGAQAMGSATWLVTIDEVIEQVRAQSKCSLARLLWDGPAALYDLLVPALTAAARASTPVAWSAVAGEELSDDACAGASGVDDQEVGAAVGATATAGLEGGEYYLEGALSDGGWGHFENKLLEGLSVCGGPVPERVAGAIRGTLRARVSGSLAAVNALDWDHLSYTFAYSETIGDHTVEESLRTDHAETAAAWLAARCGEEAPEAGDPTATVPSEALPDLTLRRAVTREVSDIREIDPGFATSAAELMDMLTLDHGFATNTISATLTGELVVPTDAVRIALDGWDLPLGGETVEDRVLDVERMIGAEASGGAYEVAGLPPLALEAAVAEVGIPHIDAELKAASRVGGGEELGIGLVEEANATAGVAVTHTMELPASIQRAQRLALFAS